MKKIVMAGAIIALISFAMCTGDSIAKTKEIQLHVIAVAEDDKTEIEVTASGESPETLELHKGVNYLSYKLGKPEVTILAYGDTLSPTITKGKWGNHYAYIEISPPRDGDSHDSK